MLIVLLVSYLLFAATAEAASPVPNIGNIINQTEPPRDIPSQKTDIPDIRSNERPPMDKSDISTIFVKGFRITGNYSVSTEILTGIANQPEKVNRDMTLADIEAVASQITIYYRKLGYFVAKAYVPKQQMIDGIIEIVVLEGKYGSFDLKNSSHVRDKTVQNMLNNIKSNDVVRLDNLERAMLLINDTPGVVITHAKLLPGAAVGTSDFNITTGSTERIDGYLVADNYGIRYTGRGRLMVGVGVNSPFGIGDKLYFNGLVSNGSDLKNGRVSYSVPLSADGLRQEIAYSKTDYSLTEEYESLDASGSSANLEFITSYPIIRSRLENLNTSLTLSFKNMKDEIKSTDVSSTQNSRSATAAFGYSRIYRLFGLVNSTDINGSYTLGAFHYDDDELEASDNENANTTGTYNKINGSVGQKMNITNTLSFNALLSFQKALGNKNLDGSEDFSIGGAYGVKVFPISEQSAENGYILNAELLYSLPTFGGLESKISVFVDNAETSQENDITDEQRRTLTDAGIGLYGNYKSFFLKAYYARIIGATKVESEPEYKSRLLVQAGMVF